MRIPFILIVTVTSMLHALLVACIAALYPHSGILFPKRPGHGDVVAEMVLFVQLERVTEAFPPRPFIILRSTWLMCLTIVEPKTQIFKIPYPPLPDWNHRGIIWMACESVASLAINLLWFQYSTFVPPSLCVVCVSSDLTTGRCGGEQVSTMCLCLCSAAFAGNTCCVKLSSLNYGKLYVWICSSNLICEVQTQSVNISLTAFPIDPQQWHSSVSKEKVLSGAGKLCDSFPVTWILRA